MKRYIPIFSIVLTAALLMATVVSALVANGSFETGNFTGWTKTIFRNAGFSAAHNSGGVDLTTIVGGAAAAPLSISDAHTSGAVKYPAYGHYSARVNDDTSYTGGGNARNANTISQNLGAFLDPHDGLAHIRFTYAAVMVNPVSSPHTAEEKPYFRVRAINTSNGNDVLYDFASYVAEPGKNWQNGPVFSGSDTWQYLDWNYIDLSPTPAHPVAAGNIITIEITAAGCSLGGHPGYVYVDEVTDGDIAGPGIRATGPATIGTGDTITYTYSYHNGAGVSIDPTVTATQPTGVTFTSTSDPTHCSLSSGKYTCNFTGVPAGGDGTFTISGTVTAALGAQIAHGGYDIGATGYPTVGGQTVLTDVNTTGTVTTITSDAPDPSLPGQSVTVNYTVTATSGTPAGTVTVTDSASAATCNSTIAVGTCNLTLPNTGPHTLTATYAGNATYNGSSDTESHTVALPNTTVTSINRNNPTPTNASSVAWTVTFANAVSGLASSNLALANGGLGGTPAITNVTAVGVQPTATWTVTASTGSGDGTLGLNMANNTGMSHNVTNVPFTGQVYTFDRTPPDTVITAQPTNPTASTTANFTFTGGGTYECSLDGAPYAACPTPNSYPGLSDGSHTFTVRAIDAVGNVDPTPASYTWVVDATPPDTTILTHPSNPTNSANAAFTFTGNDGTGTGVFSYECRLDGAPFAACTTPKNYNSLSDGSHTFDVRAIDVVGNVDPTPASYTWVVDTTPPDTTILTHPASLTNSATAAFTFTGNDGTGTGVFSYECRLDAASFAVCTTPTNFNGLGDGSHTFDVRAIDVVGNVDPTPASYTWTVDTTRPAVTINQAAAQADPTTASPINFHIVFSESVGNTLSAAEVSVTGTAGAAAVVLTEVAPMNGTTYDAAVSGMTNPGTVIANIAANMAQDAAGNGNTVSTSTDNTVNFTVNTVTTITANTPNPSSIGQSVAVTFTVTAPLGTPAGNVTVTDSDSPANCSATVAVGTCNIVLTTGGNHTLTATYPGGGGYNGSSGTSSQTVYQPASVQFSSANYEDDEYQTAQIGVTRTGDPTGTISVTFQTANGNATGGAACTPGVDYVSVTGLTVTFNPNETLKTVGIPLCPDNLTEPDQTVLLALTGANVGNPGFATLLINDTATRFRNENEVGIQGGGTSNPYPSQVTVAGGPSIIGGMRITLYDLQTMTPDSLYVMLVGPGGQKFVLMGGAGGTSDLPGPVTLNFTDSAGRVLPDTGPLVTDDFEPTTWGSVMPFPLAPAGPQNVPGSTVGGGGTQTLLGNFGGTNSNGVWTLYVYDNSAMGVPVGKFAGGWGLEFYAPTAASASVSGRVLTADGAGIKGAKVTISGNSLMEPRVTTTGSFGYYSIDGLTAGETYVITVASKRFTFQAPSRVISLVDSVDNADFVADIR